MTVSISQPSGLPADAAVRSGAVAFAKWGYAIEATASGCKVSEYWQDLRPPESFERSKMISGVEDRTIHNKAGMEATLERIAAEVEGSSE